MKSRHLATPPYRFRKFWVALGWLLVLAIVYLSVAPNPPQIDVEQGDKFGHVIAYGVLMLWFAQLYPRTGVRMAYAAGFMLLGVALEFVQRMTGYRSFEYADMIADAGGVLLGWLAGPPRLPNALGWLDTLLHSPARP
jgi:VanZ family protein